MIDNVNSPRHYTSHPSGVECIEIAQHYNFCIGNGIKYLWRQGLKSEVGMDPFDKQIEDCKKAVWYINKHISNLENERNKNGKKRPEQNEKVAERSGEEQSGTGQEAYRAGKSASCDARSLNPKTVAAINAFTTGTITDDGYNYRTIGE
jgi:hypothetical protein